MATTNFTTTPLRLVRGESWRLDTHAAVTAYRKRQQNAQAKERVRCTAVSNGHQLGVWKPDPALTDSGLVLCRYCGAGASIDLLMGEESISDCLLAPCSGVPFDLTRSW